MTLLLDLTLRQILNKLKNRDTTNDIRLQPGPVLSDAVVVLSTGRAGTKTLAALGALDKRIFARHEPQPLLYALSKCAYANRQPDNNIDIFKCAYWTARIDLLLTALQNKKCYFETSPQSTFLGPVIADVIPKAKFIHITRNPLSVIRSGMRRKWYSGHLMDSTRIEPLANSVAFEAWQTWSPFEKNIWLWRETNQWIQRFFDSLPSERYQVIQSERIFDNHPGTLSSLFDFLGVPAPAGTKIKKVLSRNMNAQTSGVFPISDEWSQEMLVLAKDILGNAAQDLGYHI